MDSKNTHTVNFVKITFSYSDIFANNSESKICTITILPLIGRIRESVKKKIITSNYEYECFIEERLGRK